MNTELLKYNGVEIPQIGYGAMVAPADTERLVSEALSTGYRMIDTAQSYLNEAEVGNAVRKYGKSIAQVALRWLLQRGVIIIPRSTKQERMAQNLMLDDFTLSAEDMEQIKTLDTGRSILFDHHDGDTTKMFMGWRNIEDLYKQV